MTQHHINTLLSLLRKHYPSAHTALRYKNPFQLLIATILSAQCTDVVVNEVTPLLFKKYPTIKALAQAPLAQLQQDIKKIGLYRNKAKFIQQTAQMLLKNFKGIVPQRLEDLIQLPGVARKTANVVLYNAFGIIAGVVVDTHVKRISYRLGLTTQTDPGKIEQDLMKKIPQKSWGEFSHAIILHGRAICQARKPKCQQCFLNTICEKKL